MIELTWSQTLEWLFQRQEQLMHRFKEIERLPAWPVPLSTQGNQRLMRDFAWRVTEEISEVFMAGSSAEIMEEMADATHFMVELCILAGVSPRMIEIYMLDWPKADDGRIRSQGFEILLSLGNACHELKAKPWKQHPKPTDEKAFRLGLVHATTELFRLWSNYGFSQQEMLRAFTDKALINDTRITEGA
jgi:phosphoribosyl-ATP pyrophosphohydrolase